MTGPLNLSIKKLSQEEFVNKYCSSETRLKFRQPIEDVFTFASKSGARNIFIGGSFITEKINPNDIDILIAYERDEQMPKQTQNITYENVRLDIFFCSYEISSILDATLVMFGHDKKGNERYVVQIAVDANAQQHIVSGAISKDIVDAVKAAYSGRNLIQRNAHKGILVSIHGLYSRAEWNVDIAPIASSQGWIFAPYVYTGNNWQLIFGSSKRRKTVDHFRHWIYDICQRYSQYTENLSIIAHSYGTYIIGKYLCGFDNLPVNLNALILTGSVLNKNYNWEDHFGNLRIGSVLNIYSPNDTIIKLMPNWGMKRLIGVDRLFGNAGYSGFACSNMQMQQRKLDILTHTNTIKRDIIEQVWMPYLENNSNSLNVRRAKK
jgi:hypothetical protein